MAISSNMNFEVATLIDITNTGQTKFRSEDRLAINQQANWNTFLQVIGLRANPYFNEKPIMVSELDITDSEFGQAFKGKHNLVPVIAGLTESVTINNNAFRTKDDASKNIIFKLADKKQ